MPHSEHARTDRRRGARLVAGIRVTIGYRDDGRADGWYSWTPEARARALADAERDYAAEFHAHLAEIERRHGIPAKLFARFSAAGRTGLAARPEPLRLYRAAVEVLMHRVDAETAAARWAVPREAVAELLSAGALRLANARRDAEKAAREHP